MLLAMLQGMRPLAVLGGLHMAPITDLAWSCNGATLAVASRDGYCSLTAFAPVRSCRKLPWT